MHGQSQEHGYGGQRRESFASYYKRSILSEGCGCAERMLDPSNQPGNRPGGGGAVLGLVLGLPAMFLRAWRRLCRG